MTNQIILATNKTMSYGHINTEKATERSQQLANYCQSNKRALPIFQLKHY